MNEAIPAQTSDQEREDWNRLLQHAKAAGTGDPLDVMVANTSGSWDIPDELKVVVASQLVLALLITWSQELNDSTENVLARFREQNGL